MSFCTTDILTLADGMYRDINSPSSLSIGYISGVLTSSGSLGDLNNRLGTSFYLSGAGPCIAGGFGQEEATIYSLAFMSNYYRKQHLATMQGGGSFVTSLSDGDSKYSREAGTKIAAEYRAMYREIEDDLNSKVALWKLNHALAVDVRAEDLASWPTP